MKLPQQTFITKALIASVALTLTLTLPANANLLSNGSFEDPVAGGWGIFSSIPGWSSTYSSIELQNGVGGWSAYAGSQWVELDVWANSDIYQTVGTTPGQAYNLSFAYSPRPDRTADTNPVDFLFNGSLIESMTGNGSGANTTWSLHNYSFTATGSSVMIQFAAGGISDGYGGFIDDVQLTAVPEPSSAVLVGLGLIGLAKFGRKRFQE